MSNNLTPILDRFYAKVEKQENGCWNWTGSLSKKGYGHFLIRCFTKKLAHQVSFLLFKGDIPPKCFVCHSCDNPRCVNPEHLWIGQAADNTKDMILKKRFFHRKLNTEDVINIRKLIKDGMKLIEIAKMYNVRKDHVSHIKTRQIWKHIP